jgi:hypothetical protein
MKKNIFQQIHEIIDKIGCYIWSKEIFWKCSVIPKSSFRLRDLAFKYLTFNPICSIKMRVITQ